MNSQQISYWALHIFSNVNIVSLQTIIIKMVAAEQSQSQSVRAFGWWVRGNEFTANQLLSFAALHIFSNEAWLE